MWSLQQCVTLFWVVFGALVALSSYRMGVGRLLEPGPGLMPLVLGVVMCILALFKFAGQRRAGRKSIDAGRGNIAGLRRRVGSIVATCLALFAYAFLLEFLGYLIITFVVMTFLLRAAGSKNWLSTVSYAAVITLVSYFGFSYLGTRFPPGLLSVPGF